MNLQTFIEAVPGYLWSDGNGSTSGLAMTAELFLLALAPGMVLAVLLAIGQAYGPRLLAWPHLVFPQHPALSAADADLLRAVSVRHRPAGLAKRSAVLAAVPRRNLLRHPGAGAEHRGVCRGIAGGDDGDVSASGVGGRGSLWHD